MSNLENISVVIPYKENLYLENILNLIKGKFKEIIIVGDNLDGFTKFPEIRFIPGKYNASEARNIGAKYATKEFIFFLDSDCLPNIKNLHNINKLKFEKKNIFNGVYLNDKKFGILSNTLSTYIKTRIRESNKKAKLFSSANFIISKSFFTDIGGFNESMEFYEDVDFNIRASVFGGNVILAEEIDVIHHKTYTLFSLIKEGFLKSLKGSLNVLLFKKYYKNIGLNVKPKYFMFVIQVLLLATSFFLQSKMAFILFFLISLFNSITF